MFGAIVSRFNLQQRAEYPSHADARLSLLKTALRRRADQWLCGLSGHRTVLRVQPGRLSLECTACGYVSPGWELDKQLRRAARDHAKHARLGPRHSSAPSRCNSLVTSREWHDACSE